MQIQISFAPIVDEYFRSTKSFHQRVLMCEVHIPKKTDFSRYLVSEVWGKYEDLFNFDSICDSCGETAHLSSLQL